MVIQTRSEDETMKLAALMAQGAKPGDIYCLDGPLGAGKTVFARGFAAGLGIFSPVTSPTFTIVHEYHQGRIPLYHFDVYRIEDPVEMEHIGWEGCFFGDGVCLVEWSENISALIPKKAIRIRICTVEDAPGCRLIMWGA